MSYPSVDALQNTLATDVFHYAADRKKAAGRALGTLVEVITFYLLRSWGFRDALAIERPLPEFANPEITHNVEYSIHPILERQRLGFSIGRLPLTAAKIRKALGAPEKWRSGEDTSNQLLTAGGVVRNCCAIAQSDVGPYIAHLERMEDLTCEVSVSLLSAHPFAIFECKRVGLEEGTRKGPQTIEKAKQGAYVARTVSSLQKIRLHDGRLGGVIQKRDGSLLCEPYSDLLRQVTCSDDPDLLRDFILTVGVVSNHGNWFTSENHNKELKVLAQSYDWLLFLTDEGLAEFINALLLAPTPELEPARKAFLASYNAKKSKNRFTKVQMDAEADAVLQKYFQDHESADRIGIQRDRAAWPLARAVARRGPRPCRKRLEANTCPMTAGRTVKSLSQDWGTPKKYVLAIRRVFGGGVDLDPCSNASSIVGAHVEYRLPEHDGLCESWDYHRIFVNPPYGADRERGTTIKHWLHRCATAHQTHGSEVLALVPVATNTGHWKKYVWGQAAAVAFLYDTRLRFLVSGRDQGKGAPNVVRDGLLGQALRDVL